MLIYFEYSFPATSDEEQQLACLRQTCLLNLAACKLKVGDAMEAESFCRQALEQDPSNVKALFRLAQALREVDKFGEASTALEKLKQCNAWSNAAAKEHRLLRSKQQAYIRHNKRVAEAMFTEEAADSSEGSGDEGDYLQPDVHSLLSATSA